MKLMPENQFQPSLQSVRDIADRYGLEAVSYNKADSGIENTTLIVSSTAGTHAFRIYRRGKKTDSQIKAEISFMDYLRSRHVPVPAVLPNSFGELLTLSGPPTEPWQVIVMEYVTGNHPESLPPVLLKQLATTQARMHQLASGYNGPTDAVRTLTKLVETEFIRQIDFDEMLRIDNRLVAFLERGAAYSVSFDRSLPTGLCHLDYNKRNILSQADRLAAVLDFDDLAAAPYVVCLAYALWHIRDDFGADAADTYLRHYEQLRPLSSMEKQVLPRALLFRHYMISAIKILSGKTSSLHIQHYLKIESYLQSSLL